MPRNGKIFFKLAATWGLILAAVLLLNANSRSDANDADAAACDLCQEMLVGSFSCAVQGGEVVAQVNFQGTGSLTPSPTGAGIVVLGGLPGGEVNDCESLATRVTAEMRRGDCAAGRTMSPIPNQRVFDFACHTRRASLVRVMAEISEEVISLSP
jgi:hypothetical protein